MDYNYFLVPLKRFFMRYFEWLYLNLAIFVFLCCWCDNSFSNAKCEFIFLCFPLFTRLQFFCECIIFSINGENKHYGTPNNPAAPACVPGGSCSGAAVAVAANLVDFSLGNLLFCCLYSKVCLLTFSRYSLDLDIQIFSWIHVALCTIS